MEPCAEGEKGLLSIYDPTMIPYPAFIISDDMMRISDFRKCDGCGMISQDMIKYEGRAPEAELRSCGLKTQQILDDESRELLKQFRVKQALREGIGF